MNNADSFSQPSLIIFTKGAYIFDYDCKTMKSASYFHVNFFNYVSLT